MSHLSEQTRTDWWKTYRHQTSHGMFANWRSNLSTGVRSYCYSGLFAPEDSGYLEYIYLFGLLNEYTSERGKWVDFVLNRAGIFSKAFVTKNAEDFYTKGVEVDTTEPFFLVQCACQMLRQGLETSSFGWWTFLDLGFSEEDAYVLASNFSVSEDKTCIGEYEGFYEHLPLPLGSPYKAYFGGLYKESNDIGPVHEVYIDEEDGPLADSHPPLGEYHPMWSAITGVRAVDPYGEQLILPEETVWYEVEDLFGAVCKIQGMPLTKELCESLLSRMKGQELCAA